MNQNQGQIESVVLSKPRLQKRIRVLLIDDDSDFSELLAGALEDVMGISVDRAADPFEAIEKMEDGAYHALILDWNLPHLNGAQTLKRTEVSFVFEPEMSKQWEHRQVPVIVISAHSEEMFSFHDSPHFRVTSFISKRQSLASLLVQLREALVGEGLMEQSA